MITCDFVREDCPCCGKTLEKFERDWQRVKVLTNVPRKIYVDRENVLHGFATVWVIKCLSPDCMYEFEFIHVFHTETSKRVQPYRSILL